MKDEHKNSIAQMLQTASVLYLDGKNASKVKDYLSSGYFLWKAIGVGESNEGIVVFNAGRATVEFIAKRNGVEKYSYHTIQQGLLTDSLATVDSKKLLSGILSDCDARIKEIIRKHVPDEKDAMRYLHESLAGGMNAYYKRMMLYGKETL